ncbi:DUF1604-domain-containing protein [Terfezia boudieri ATCC MYA-4762]|uniref:DUF1604-domain-containing protein n=1 Tax=Terfezia boudieri ATCC MYA-4762 TaxID=1051890 RepID=A0A3N4M2T8_9PEZI|nr:DUF1604-domain-containing protein [Terfezia boudieri ATCC MYA-4762]
MKRTRTTYENKEPRAEFVVYGTPLPQLDSNIRDDGSFVPIWKQEVTDERGRKRLHGAFTGGFSAGYFNTVGSKEGWAPSAFKSSRDARAKAVQVRPEDFMDEEDFAAVAEEKVLETNRNFTGWGSTADELSSKAKLTVMDLLKPPPEEMMGVKLLKKMGWKDGQGIGPKVRRAAVIFDDETGQEITEHDKIHNFAPQNSAVITLEKKDDYSGLGYTGSIKQESIRDQRLEAKVERELVRKGGFGVGVLNDEDEDDGDIYEIKPKTTYNRVIGGDKKKTTKPCTKLIAPAKHVFISKKIGPSNTSFNVRKCFDGRLPLPGFTIASEPIQTKDGWYPPPQVPQGWTPTPPLLANTNSPNPSQLQQGACSSEIKLDPRSRGALLGEASLPGKSVFDYMSPAARERVAAATGKSNLPQALNEAPPPGYTPSPPAGLVPKLSQTVALGALNGGFMPYADDMEKRGRYRKFLEIQAGLREGLPDRRPSMTNGDWVNELNEFANCARIFKPASGMISSRFTSSTSAMSQIKTDEGLVSTNPETLMHRPQKKELSTAEQAAKMGMYGGLTRTIEEFWPTRLLCKRFNVRPPKHVESALNNENGVKPGSRVPTHIDTSTSMQQPTQLFGESPIRPQPPLIGPKELISRGDITEMMREVKGDANYELPKAAESVMQVDLGTNEALEGERAADDVFKAIFGDDGDD